MRLRLLSAIPAVVAAVTLAACGGGAGTEGASGDGLTVVATEYEFEPADVTIPADTPTEVTVDNQGIIEHDWTVDELEVLIHADPGESATDSVTAAAGTYDIYCSIPGHRELGMEGVLTVE
jgi:uncharacterized cupredoxin-like copper-binding protein